jgi:lipoprotein-anchoring transpeptidase ErfK/SrfK
VKRRRWVASIATLMILIFGLVPAAFADSTYVVQPGDTLFRIAYRHGLTTLQLAQANGITDVDRIYAGQVLTIPDPDAAPPAAAPAAPPSSGDATTYVVQRGDHLSAIAQRFGLTWPVLAQANGITNPDRIYAGQLLTIPAPGTVSVPAAAPVTPPPGTGATERWVDVNLTTQTFSAYEGSTLVRSAYISSGTWAHPTVTGQFRVYIRYESQTMDGRRLGYDYYLPNVPYVMYFYRDYALHGTYWHSNFGTPMSHGCVNMNTADAQWLFYWSSYGTLVNVHY